MNCDYNSGINFDFSGFITIPMSKILTSKIQKTKGILSSFKIFEIEANLQLLKLKFNLEFRDDNSQNWP